MTIGNKLSIQGKERERGGKGEREIKGFFDLLPLSLSPSLPLALSISVCLLMTLGTACHQTTPEEQQTQGETLYQAYCASCHEINQGIGPRLTKQVLATRVSALALFTYNQKNMPYNAGNTLKEEEYWAVTAYLLAREGFLESALVLDAENAEGLRLEQ